MLYFPIEHRVNIVTIQNNKHFSHWICILRFDVQNTNKHNNSTYETLIDV